MMLPLIRGRGGRGLLFRHIQIVLVDIPGGLRDHDLIPVAALANDLHLRTPEVETAPAGTDGTAGDAVETDSPALPDGATLGTKIVLPEGVTISEDGKITFSAQGMEQIMENARQKAGDHALNLHALYPP